MSEVSLRKVNNLDVVGPTPSAAPSKTSLSEEALAKTIPSTNMDSGLHIKFKEGVKESPSTCFGSIPGKILSSEAVEALKNLFAMLMTKAAEALWGGSPSSYGEVEGHNFDELNEEKELADFKEAIQALHAPREMPEEKLVPSSELKESFKAQGFDIPDTVAISLSPQEKADFMNALPHLTAENKEALSSHLEAAKSTRDPHQLAEIIQEITSLIKKEPS